MKSTCRVSTEFKFSISRTFQGFQGRILKIFKDINWTKGRLNIEKIGKNNALGFKFSEKLSKTLDYRR